MDKTASLPQVEGAALQNKAYTEAACAAITQAVAKKQDKLTGVAGQVVGFDASGNAVAQKGVSETELKIMNGDLILTKQGVYGLTGLAYGNNMYVAVKSGNTIYKSNDGITWSEITVPVNSDWRSIRYNGRIFLAVGTGTKAISSADGTTWKEISMPENNIWKSIAVNKSGNFIVSAGNKIAKSSILGLNSIGIALVDTTVPFSPAKIEFGGSSLIAIASGRAAYSENGTDWTEVSFPINSDNLGLAYAEGKFVAVYDYGFAYSADDGKTWSSGNWPSGPIGQYNCITCGNGKFIASGSGYLNYSIDGITWWYDQYSDLLNPNAAAYGQDGFVLASDYNGTLHYKSDTKITMNQVNAAIQLAIKNLGLSS